MFEFSGTLYIVLLLVCLCSWDLFLALYITPWLRVLYFCSWRNYRINRLFGNLVYPAGRVHPKEKNFSPLVSSDEIRRNNGVLNQDLLVNDKHFQGVVDFFCPGR
uniref:Uncharacterized protein n=1 Tax=Megaselia scalaris TaxID=36166 RepID=T1GME1_MEGSC